VIREVSILGGRGLRVLGRVVREMGIESGTEGKSYLMSLIEAKNTRRVIYLSKLRKEEKKHLLRK